MSHENQVKLFAVKVPKKEGESVRKALLKQDLLLNEYEILRDEEYLYFPVKSIQIDGAGQQYEFVSKFFTHIDQSVSYQEEIKHQLPDKLHKFIPSSYDRLGDIILIKIPEELYDYTTMIGKVMLKTLGVNAVYMKQGDISSIYRTTRWECIAGEDNPIILHKMNNLRFKLNINSAYFNNRLGIEYKRIVDNLDYLDDGMTIIDMFAGIGPFSILCAVKRQVKVYCCDINPKAIQYLNENIELNKSQIRGEIYPFLGDISEKINSFPRADLIFMNLPGAALGYLELALHKLKPNGRIFLHHFLRIKDKSHPREISIQNDIILGRIYDTIAQDKLPISHVQLENRVIREVSPSKSHLVFEIVAS